MNTYQVPTRDMLFVLRELHGEQGVLDLAAFADFDDELVDSVIDEAGRFCVARLAPLNASGDREGCVFEQGAVRTPAGFREAYADFAAAGWSGFAAAPEHGGQGLPQSVEALFTEMQCSSNLSFSMYPGLSHGAYKAVRAYGDEALAARFLPALATGRWTGTMCLTEPQCGTDLGLVRTRADPLDAEGYRVNGQKIFISCGEHDLAENILHLVLARLPDAPSGTAGLSLFLVPKYEVDETGGIGQHNGVVCTGIEDKMGVHASSTCALSFEDAHGHLVGQPNQGMRAMFVMMNGARLAVAIHGLGVAEAACQMSRAYAAERRQGRAIGGAREPDSPADPILVHPDVRRMLLTMRAYTEGGRALVGWIATMLDRSKHHPDADGRRSADDLVALLTPIAKALLTDLGSEIANLAVQVHGGHGYIRDTGVEQLVRDARICQIYEGTNGVQAMDLIGRKLGAHNGRYLRAFFHPAVAFTEAHRDDPSIGPLAASLAKALERLQRATAWMAMRGLARPEEPAAVATDYLRLFGLVALAYMHARAAGIAQQRITEGADDDGYYRAKFDLARFYFARLLPASSGLFGSIMAGGATTLEPADEVFLSH